MGNRAYKLKLPRSIKSHPVVHVSDLEPYLSEDPFPGQINPPPLPVIIEGEQEWEVEEVLDSRYRYRKLEYKVKWAGEEETTWQPAADLEHSPELVAEFHQKYPSKPHP